MSKYSEALEALTECIREGREVPREVKDAFFTMGFDYEQVERKARELDGARLYGWPEIPGHDVLPWNGLKEDK